MAIVGGGPGGLASALLLARHKARVTLFERAPALGGRSALIREAGFTFDTGPTFFLYPRVLEEIVASCGFDLRREVDLLQLDPMYRLQFEAGQRIDATADLPALQRQIAAFDAHDGANLPAFMEENRRKLALFRPALERGFDSVRDLLSPEVLRALPLLRPLRSVDADLRRHFRHPLVRLAFSFQCKYLGMSPFQCPSLFTILSFLEYEHGVFHPRGGCGAVMEALGRIARRMGVDIRLSQPVERIEISGRRATGVRVGGGFVPADAVLVNADFAHAMKTLVPNAARRRWTDGKLARKKYSCSTFMLYLGIEGAVEELPHHTVYLAEDFVGNLRDLDEGRRLTENPSVYVQNACRTDPTLAPKGCSTLYLLVPVPHRSEHIDWNDTAAARARAFRQLERLGVRDLERRIRVERMMTPRSWEEQGIYRGATFNLRHSYDQMLCFRPHNRFEDLDRVYLVGGGTHPGSGLPVIFESARISARALCDDLGLQERARAPANQPAMTPAMMETV
ncbi:MAG: phytoene desaturase [Acetobacteraceae bacterium]|nr:phytoene desaturase [Acetobacteraceae bacterium]